MCFVSRFLMVRLVSLGSRLPTRLSMPSCSQPSRTLRAADAVARRWAILDRRCARRHGPRAGRDGRMVPIEQKDWTRRRGAQDFPLPLPARPIVFGKRKRHHFCDHHLSLVADRDKSGFVLFCFVRHIARTKCALHPLTSLFAAVSSNSVSIFDDGNKSRIISNRDQKKGQIPSRIMVRLTLSQRSG